MRPFGVVYFLLSPEVERVKIGHTEAWDGKRIIDLQMANAAVVEPVAYLRGTATIERAVHALFREHRHHGEWFQVVPELETFVQDFATVWPTKDHPDPIEICPDVAKLVACRTLKALEHWKARKVSRWSPPPLDWSTGLPFVERWKRSILDALDESYRWLPEYVARMERQEELDEQGRQFQAERERLKGIRRADRWGGFQLPSPDVPT